MTKEEFVALKPGDVVYVVSNIKIGYNMLEVVDKEIDANVVYYKMPLGYNMGVKYQHVYNTETEVKEEIIRRIEDKIATYMSSITNCMTQINSVDKDALNNALLSKIIDRIREQYNVLKGYKKELI